MLQGRLVESHSLSKRTVVAIFVALMVAMFVSSLDQTIVSTALPTIAGEMGAVDHMLWVTTAYFLASTIMMPVYGKLGDMVGRKHLLIAALALFVAGSLVCACASSMAWLVAGRAVQGVGGGGLMILSQAIVGDIFPPKERGKYMGIMGASFGVSMAVGPLIGGGFTELLSWRWCFWINIPLGIAALAVAAILLPHRGHRKAAARFDYCGFATMAASVTCLILALSFGGSVYEWASAEMVVLFAGFVAFAVIFVLVERKAAEPLIPLMLFKNRNFLLCTAAGLAIMVAMSGVISYLPTYFQIVDGLEATLAGYMMLPLMVGMMATSTASGLIASRVRSVKWMPLLSCAIAAASLAALASITVDTTLWQMGVMLFALGFGMGLGQQMLVLIVQNEFSSRIVGTATAANNFFREIGGTVGGSLVGSLFSANLMGNLAGYASEGLAGMDANSLTPSIVQGLDEATKAGVQAAYNDALAPVLGALVPLLAIAFILLLFLKDRRLKDTND